MKPRIEMIRQRLSAALQIEAIDIIDDSHRHVGHVGARDGGGHYQVRIVSPDFEGKRSLERHRMVYQAMGDAMRNDTIHALNIEALTPAEAGSNATS
jgi:BolA protein